MRDSKNDIASRLRQAEDKKLDPGLKDAMLKNVMSSPQLATSTPGVFQKILATISKKTLFGIALGSLVVNSIFITKLIVDQPLDTINEKEVLVDTVSSNLEKEIDQKINSVSESENFSSLPSPKSVKHTNTERKSEQSIHNSDKKVVQDSIENLEITEPKLTLPPSVDSVTNNSENITAPTPKKKNKDLNTFFNKHEPKDSNKTKLFK